MNSSKLWLSATIISMTVVGLWATVIPRDFSTDFRASVEQYLKTITSCQKIPAMSVAVLKFSPGTNPSETVELSYKWASGITSVGSQTQVTPTTPFCINSQTQTFTTLLVAKAVEAGMVDWDTLVSKISGQPPFSSLQLNSLATLRDLLSQRSGIPAYKAFQLAGTSLKTREDLKKFFLSLPVKENNFRSGYVDNSFVYGYLGSLVETAGKNTYEELLKATILTPMGLVDYRFLNESATKDTFALPHLYNSVSGMPTPVGSEMLKTIKPLGSANSLCLSNNDVFKWLRFQLDNGKVGDKQLIASASLDEIFSPSTLVRPPAFDLTKDVGGNIFTLDKNGLGWMKGVYQGYEVAVNYGSLMGSQSAMWLFPKSKIGIYVGLTGVIAQTRPVANYIASFIASNVLSISPPLHPADYICALKDKSDEVVNNDFDATKPECSCANLGSDVVAKIAGEYVHEALGSVVVEGKDDKTITTVSFGNYGKAKLCQWKDVVGRFWLQLQDPITNLVKSECPVTTKLPFSLFMEFLDYNTTQQATKILFDYLEPEYPPVFIRKGIVDPTTPKSQPTGDSNNICPSAILSTIGILMSLAALMM